MEQRLKAQDEDGRIVHTSGAPDVKWTQFSKRFQFLISSDSTLHHLIVEFSKFSDSTQSSPVCIQERQKLLL